LGYLRSAFKGLLMFSLVSRTMGKAYYDEKDNDSIHCNEARYEMDVITEGNLRKDAIVQREDTGLDQEQCEGIH
jgi:hypothetical protein